jgi:hypothetical protein
MSWTGSMPRSTRASKIPMTCYNSRPASAACSPLILSHLQRLLQAKKDRCSSNIQLRSVSCLDLELEARTKAKKSCQTTSARTLLASLSMHTSPTTHSKAANPSSHAAMAPSLLSSSLSRARSYPCSSTTTAFGGNGALHQSTSTDRRHNKEASLGKAPALSKDPPDR